MAQELVLPEGQHLEIPEVLRRIAPAFRYVCIDWLVGDQNIRGAVELLRQWNAPEEMIEAASREVRRRVEILVSDSGEPTGQVVFRMGAGQPTFLLAFDPSHQYEPSYRALLEKLGTLLGGAFEESEWD
jgi:hypothetical protein